MRQTEPINRKSCQVYQGRQKFCNFGNTSKQANQSGKNPFQLEELNSEYNKTRGLKKMGLEAFQLLASFFF